jgi:anaerobic selenocysteine-containing dehydrogenase
MEESSETKAVTCCACSQQCGVLVHLKDGVIVKISGDKDHPLSQGFICVKGARAAELHYSPQRLNWPFKRSGARGQGKWEQISWEQALDEIAGKVRPLVEKFGSETVAMSFGTFHAADWGLGERFLNLLGSPNTVGQDKVCYGPITIAEMLTYGFGPTSYTYPVPGLTKCIVLWGMRPSASMPLLWAQIVKARREGANLIVVDPLLTTEARQADLWLQLRPGSDTALALGWLNVVIGDGAYDHAFVRDSTVGFPDLAERVARWTSAAASRETWLPETAIVKAARIFAANPPAIIAAGNGLCQIGSNSVQAARALACLVAISGNLDRAGAHRMAGPPRQIIANGHAVLVDALSAEQRAKRLGADRYGLLGQAYGAMDNAMARAWYGQHHVGSWATTAHEPAMWAAIMTGKPYPVKALFIQHHNPVGGSANVKQVVEALTSPDLDLLVVHDIFMSPTAQFADYALPASHWLEKPFFSTGYAYMGFVGDYADANAAPLAAQFERRSDYELWRDLGHRLGQESFWPQHIEQMWEEWLRPAGMHFVQLAARRGPWIGSSSASDTAFGTPSGKVELKSSILEEFGIDSLPDHSETELFQRFGTEYPLVLTTGGRVIEGFHQNAQQMAWFRKKYPDPQATIHPRTARELDIAEGSWILIETPIGTVKQVARLSGKVHPRVIHADRWWYPEREGAAPELFGVLKTNINVCTRAEAADCDPIMGAWPLRAMPCRVIPE